MTMQTYSKRKLGVILLAASALIVTAAQTHCYVNGSVDCPTDWVNPDTGIDCTLENDGVIHWYEGAAPGQDGSTDWTYNGVNYCEFWCNGQNVWVRQGARLTGDDCTG